MMILEVQGLNKSFKHPWTLKSIQVLMDVSFKIEKKSIVGFLGANGAGKTTSIKCLIGLLKYQSGKISVFGKNHLSNEVKKQVGYLPERPFFYSYLTAYEFLRFYGQLSGLSGGKELDMRIDHLLEMVGLSHARSRYLKQFSKGMLQRVGMAQALIHRPRLLILDEPLSGLDPDGRRQLVEIIENTFSEEDTTIFFSSHLLDDIDRLCRELVLIKDGRVRFNGLKKDFVQQGSSTYLIKYQKPGLDIESTKSENLSVLQEKIDQLRNSGHQILQVETEKMSLDHAFAKFNDWEKGQ